MRLSKIAAAGLATWCILAKTAEAGWNYLDWGMTQKAAIDAAKGEARLVKAGDDVVCAFVGQKPFATIPRKKIGEFQFQVTFCSAPTGGALTSVALATLDSPNIPSLKRTLISQYGKPTVETGNTAIWNDKALGNTISFWSIVDRIGRIEYKKLGGTGL